MKFTVKFENTRKANDSFEITVYADNGKDAFQKAFNELMNRVEAPNRYIMIIK